MYHLWSRQGPNATVAEIRSAFRRELLVYHPDHSGSSGLDPDAAAKRTRALYDAYAVLRDPAKRAEYDRRMFRF